MAQKAGKLNNAATVVAAICHQAAREMGRPVRRDSRYQINAINASVTQPKYIRWLCAWRTAVKLLAQDGI